MESSERSLAETIDIETMSEEEREDGLIHACGIILKQLLHAPCLWH